jgi:hypothetical protein
VLEALQYPDFLATPMPRALNHEPVSFEVYGGAIRRKYRSPPSYRFGQPRKSKRAVLTAEWKNSIQGPNTIVQLFRSQVSDVMDYDSAGRRLFSPKSFQEDVLHRLDSVHVVFAELAFHGRLRTAGRDNDSDKCDWPGRMNRGDNRSERAIG